MGRGGLFLCLCAGRLPSWPAPPQAFRARDLGQVLGLIEAVPIVPLLNKLAPEARSSILRTFMEIMKSGTEAGVKEATQKFTKQLVAAELIGFDPDGRRYETVIDSFEVAFTSDVLKDSLRKALGLGKK